MGIYIHIPFCVKKCNYCDFLSDVGSASLQKEYVDAMLNEIVLWNRDDDTLNAHEVSTIFIGGGTPSVIKASYIADILDAIRQRFNVKVDAEITIECNPGSADREKLAAYRDAGINRISIGLQSANDEELKILGRVHDLARFEETYRLAKEVGFDNINVDLMSAIPGQTLESYRNTLEKVIALGPQHISAYSLIIEEGTPFYDIYGEGGTGEGHIGEGGTVNDSAKLYPPLPDEDQEREMYYLTEELLAAAGYHRYEISNYSLEGYECRHNKSYWDGTEYLGFGLGSAGYIYGVRYSNTSDLDIYINACNNLNAPQSESYFEYYTGVDEYDEPDEDEAKEASDETGNGESFATAESDHRDFLELLKNDGFHEGVHRLSVNDKMEEFMFLGLRMMNGISMSEFKKRFNRDIREVYGNSIDKLKDEGLLEESEDILRLTHRGIDVSNIALANFLL
ncbi:MAG: radical SAM family heme chaperone HemW [Lachnospiraceae bacterium]|nr:radical SAM family heme chaperone HemW [Lachnospiraceae bacterium]